MFLVIPLVEFLHVLGVDINVHHENPATFLCHVSVSSVKRSRHRFASSRWHPVLTPRAQERHETPTGSYLSFKVHFTPRLQVHHGLPVRLSPNFQASTAAIGATLPLALGDVDGFIEQ